MSGSWHHDFDSIRVDKFEIFAFFGPQNLLTPNLSHKTLKNLLLCFSRNEKDQTELWGNTGIRKETISFENTILAENVLFQMCISADAKSYSQHPLS